MADTILFLMNGWHSAAGGIQTVNRELASAVAKLRSDLRCVAVVTTATEGEVRDAFSRNVQLIHGNSADDWSSAVSAAELKAIAPENVIAVIGHSTFSGAQARTVRDNLFPGAKLVQFVHTSPLHVEGMKEQKRNSYVTAREKKLADEIQLASASDLVVCIGPRLYRAMHDMIVPQARQDIAVRQINCGVWRDAGPARERPLRPTILSLGRTESIGVKGLDILAYAAGHLHQMWMGHPSTKNRPSPQFIIRGTKENAEEFEAELVKMAIEVGPKPTIIVRPYTSNSTELEADYRGASIFIMPSREEGFGLVACEAMSLGTPTLVSAESGVAEVLTQVAMANHMDPKICVVPIDGDPQEAGKRFAEAALAVLTDYERMRGYFEMMAEHMLSLSSWETGARQLLEELGVAPPLSPAQLPQVDATSVVERARNDLLAHAGVISVGVEEVIVVRVSRHAPPPKLPADIDGVAVVIRESDPIQLTASTGGASGDLMIGNHRRASATILRLAGRTLVLTAKHAVQGAAGMPIFVLVAGRRHIATVSRVGANMDWALLEVPTLPDDVPAPELLRGPPSGEVVLRFDGRIYRGQITTRGVVAEISGTDGKSERYHDLLEVRIEGDPPSGASGALVVSARTGAAVGMVVAAGRSDHGTSIFCYSLKAVLDDLGPSASTRRPARQPVRIGILTTDQATLSFALEQLGPPERRALGGRLLFSGRDKASGHMVTICHSPSFGNIAAAISTLELIKFGQPDHVLVVGLGGGLDSNKLSVGDVVVASEVLYYEAGVIGGEASPPRVQIVGKTSANIMDRVRRVAMTIAEEGRHSFRVVIGSIASGEKIVRDAQALRTMLSWSQLLAVDMESAGAMEAASAAEPEVGVVTIRGIADMVGVSDRGDGRAVAAQNAVTAAFALVNTL